MIKQFTPAQRFEIPKDFWGYGNPKTSEILFIGIEEANDWSISQLAECKKAWALESLDDEQIVDWLIGKMEKRFITNDDWPPRKTPYPTTSPIERMQAYLALRLNPATSDTKMKPSEYMAKGCFLREREFQANVFPIGCNGAGAWCEDTLRWFPLPASKERYRQDVLGHRCKVLEVLIGTMTTKLGESPVIFVMGKQIWDSKHVWKSVEPILNVRRFLTCEGLSGFQHSDDFSVWLTPHPSFGGISYEQADKMLELINNNKMRKN